MKSGTVIIVWLFIAAAAFGQQAADFKTSGFWARLGIGVPIPISLSSEVLTPGFNAAPAAGYRFPLGPGRMLIGLETGIMLEFTRDSPSVDQYTSCLVPLAALAEYDLPLAGIFHAYGGVQAGFGVTFVDYALPFLTDLTVGKLFLGLEFGAGLDVGIFVFQVGARLFAVFYDVNTYLALVPGMRAVIRFPSMPENSAPKRAQPSIKGGKR
jgi:hypothetical protein